MSQNIAVFVAWPYANGDLHLGHVAGAYLPADIFARFHRLRGNNVMMASGSDSHGTPITLKAKEKGVSPREVVEEYHERFIEDFKALGIQFDIFTHTLTKNHAEVVTEIFKTLVKKGDLEVHTEEQFFDEKEQMFLADRYVKGECPVCGYERARGDECEKCGKTFESTSIKNPISTLSNTTPVLKETDHFYLHMERYQERLAAWVSSKSQWRNHVESLTNAWIQDGLRPRAVTRDIDWGIPVPVKGWESKVIYVWFDAVIGYLSASKEYGRIKGNPDLWKDWWLDKDAKTYYFIGKDNIPFHTVIWPIELMAYDENLNLPYDVPANQFLNIEGEKFSTSRGHAVWLREILETLDADALRFYMASILPETKDANYSKEELKLRNNGELTSAWGNLVQRVIGFTAAKLDGIIPAKREYSDRDRELLSQCEHAFKVVEEHYQEVRLRDALRESMNFVREINKYLDDTAPWTLIKTDRASTEHVISVAFDMILSANMLLAPILPFSAQVIQNILGDGSLLFPESSSMIVDEKEDKHIVLTNLPFKTINRFFPMQVEVGRNIVKGDPLFKILE